MRTGIAGAKRIHAVKGVLRASIPEIAVVEHRIDYRRRVARRGAAHVHGAAIAVRDAPDGIDDASLIFGSLAEHYVIKVEAEHTLRAHDVVVVAGSGVQREVAECQTMIWTKARMERS